jgi:hypothetical protein
VNYQDNSLTTDFRKRFGAPGPFQVFRQFHSPSDRRGSVRGAKSALGGFVGEHVANFGLGKKTGLLLPSRFPGANFWEAFWFSKGNWGKFPGGGGVTDSKM